MHSRRLLMFALAALSIVFQVSGASAHEVWKVVGGRTTFNFQAERLQGIGISLDNVEITATAPDPVVMDIEPPYWNMAITPESNFQFEVDNDHFVYYTASAGWGQMQGSIHHRGGLTFRDQSGATGELRNFVIDFVGAANDGPGGEKSPRVYYVRQPNSPVSQYTLEFEDEMPIFHRDSKKLIMYVSVQMTPEFAHQLGHDWMAHQCIGRAEVAADCEYVSGASTEAPFVPNVTTADRFAPPAPGQPLTTGIDVSLGALSSITEYGRAGTYPNGFAGISMSTTSCNLGTKDVHWYAPMNFDHPGIAMSTYREENGRFEQIGVSYMKHGFYALSNSDCTPCQHPSGGTFLGVGCSDTYSSGNNADRTYLGPRREWNAFSSAWRCNNTHFSSFVDDCTRRHSGSGHDGAQHRCRTPDSTLGHAGATYYYEGNYLVVGDELIHNNAGSRRFTSTWTGSAWNLSTPGSNPLVEGPAIERWGDMRTLAAMAPDDGNVYVAVKTTALGGGITHYEYAVYNFNSFREVQSFSLPVGAASITNIGFHAPVTEIASQSAPWAMTLSAGTIRWDAQPFSADSINGNALTFGYLFNFRFDASAPPVDGTASLDSWRSGAPGPASFATKVPQAVATSVAAGMPGIRITDARPNPLNPTTTISFSLQQGADASLEIFGAEGRRVKSLSSGRLDAGSHQFSWDGTDASGTKVAPGVYYYRLTAGGEEAAQSLIVIR